MCDKDKLLSEIDKMDSMLKKAEDLGCLSHLYDGKFLNVVMKIAVHIDNVISDVQMIGGKSLPVHEYFFYRDTMRRLYDIKERFTEIKFTSEHTDTYLEVEDYNTYSEIFQKVILSDNNKQADVNFDQLYDSICEIQLCMQNVDARVHSSIQNVLDYVVYEMSKVIYDMTSFENEKNIIECGAKDNAVANYQSIFQSLTEQTSRLCEDCPFDLETDHWKKMKITEDKALRYAIEGKLVDSQDECLVGYSESLRKEMEENKKMIRKLVAVFPYNQLFDFDSLKGKFFGGLYVYLNYTNIDLFYYLVLRGNIIRFNCYPKIQPKFDAWLKGEEADETINKEEKENEVKCELSETDNNAMQEVLGILAKGSWNKPSNTKNIAEWFEVLFGAKPKKLDKEDIDASEEFRKFFRTGKGSKLFSRLHISIANLIGYLMEYDYLDRAPKQLSIDFFEKSGNETNINHGKENGRSATFEKLIPFMDKYRLRIIEKHN